MNIIPNASLLLRNLDDLPMTLRPTILVGLLPRLVNQILNGIETLAKNLVVNLMNVPKHTMRRPETIKPLANT